MGRKIFHIFFKPDDSVVCEQEDVWPEAKATFSAILRCNAKDNGVIKRQCTGSSGPGVWGPVISECVNTEISGLLTQAQV